MTKSSEPQIVRLYNDKVEIKFYPDSHAYFVNGKRVGSVTGRIGIIDKSKALIPWAVDMGSDYLSQFVGKKLTEKMILEAAIQHEVKKEEAANIGTMGHDWIEKFCKGENPEMPNDPRVLNVVNGFLQFAEEHKLKVVSSEQIVYSKKHNFIGIMDATAKMNGHRGLFVIDYKSSNGLYPSVAYQTAGYQKADEEESGREYEGRWAIRLAKETEEEYMVRMEKKLKKWCLKNPQKSPYKITPYVPFEARFLDQDPGNIERDFRVFLLCNELSTLHYEVDREFFPGNGNS